MADFGDANAVARKRPSRDTDGGGHAKRAAHDHRAVPGRGHNTTDPTNNKRKRNEGPMGKNTAVLNKNAAEEQITAEQLVREAYERGHVVHDQIQTDIQGEEELKSYQAGRRKEFEDELRMNKQKIGTWVRYATFESSMRDFVRARNVYERALCVDKNNHSLWLKYVDMEQREGFFNHARNIFDRVTLHLPRVDQFWYKYAYMEEMLGNFAGARAIFERWMDYEPEDQAWLSFIKFEERCKEIDKARRIFERYVECVCSQISFSRMAKFEDRYKNPSRARSAYEMGIKLLEDEIDENFWISFAAFETRQKEYERARAIYKAALDRIPKDQAEELYQRYINFEKTYGGQEEIEDTVLQKRRFHYEAILSKNPRDYDTWFDYLRMMESTVEKPNTVQIEKKDGLNTIHQVQSSTQIDEVRELYERAISQMPPLVLKDHWKRYIYLWYNYALFEENVATDMPKSRKIYDTLLKLTSSKKLVFAKLYKLYAEFEVRRLNLAQARRIFGRGLGEAKKPKIFQWYAEIEARFGNFDICRGIYEKLCETFSREPHGWVQYLEFEESLEELDRAREVAEIGLEHVTDMPEILWRRYIDMEIAHENLQHARELYSRLAEQSNWHIRVIETWAEFEGGTVGASFKKTITEEQKDTIKDSITEEESKENEGLKKMREVIERGITIAKNEKNNEQRAMLIDFLVKMEKKYGTQELVELAEKRIPKKTKARRLVNVRRDLFGVDDNDGNDSDEYEEYLDYVFPDDKPSEQNIRLIDAAKRWKEKKKAMEAAKANKAR